MADAGTAEELESGPGPGTYRRSADTPKGMLRREQLLALVTADLSAHGLVDFSLRRAARAAGTTHKVLLYYFEGADDLLAQAVLRLRQKRIDDGLAAAGATADGQKLSGRVRALWPVLIGLDSWVLEQAIGLAMFDPARHGALGWQVSRQYRPAFVSLCPPDWSDQRKSEVAEMILAVLRGFLVDWRTTGGDPAGIAAGYEALVRALDREEAEPERTAPVRLAAEPTVSRAADG